MWPTSSFSLQVRVMACLGILVIGRVVNLYTPIYYKHIVDAFTPGPGKTLVFPVDLILMVGVARVLFGSRFLRCALFSLSMSSHYGPTWARCVSVCLGAALCACTFPLGPYGKFGLFLRRAVWVGRLSSQIKA